VRLTRVDVDEIRSLRRLVLGDSALAGDRSADHWAALDGDTVVGCLSLFDLRGRALRAMAVHPDRRREGIGRDLLVAAMAHETTLWCNARLAAVPFYEACGWVCRGPRFPLADRGLHQRMTWQRAFL
jgi:GNAT superfamily N-acetyltransferase